MLDGSTFWSTMGQVSATFAGLVFVGITLYIGSIKAAMDEVGPELKQECKSVSLMYAAVVTNLMLFLLPMMLSFYMISEQTFTDDRYFIYFLLFVIIAMVVSNYRIYNHKRFSNDMRDIKEKGKPDHRLERRVKFGKAFLPVLSVLIIFFVILNYYVELPSFYPVIKGIAILCIFIGLVVGVYDIYAFDSSHIYFKLVNSPIELEYGITLTKIEEKIKSIRSSKYDDFKNTVSDREYINKFRKSGYWTESQIDIQVEYLNSLFKRFEIIEDSWRSLKGETIEAYTVCTLDNIRTKKYPGIILKNLEKIEEELDEQIKRFPVI